MAIPLIAKLLGGLGKSGAAKGAIAGASKGAAASGASGAVGGAAKGLANNALSSSGMNQALGGLGQNSSPNMFQGEFWQQKGQEFKEPFTADYWKQQGQQFKEPFTADYWSSGLNSGFLDDMEELRRRRGY